MAETHSQTHSQAVAQSARQAPSPASRSRFQKEAAESPHRALATPASWCAGCVWKSSPTERSGRAERRRSRRNPWRSFNHGIEQALLRREDGCRVLSPAPKPSAPTSWQMRGCTADLICSSDDTVKESAITSQTPRALSDDDRSVDVPPAPQKIDPSLSQGVPSNFDRLLPAQDHVEPFPSQGKDSITHLGRAKTGPRATSANTPYCNVRNDNHAALQNFFALVRAAPYIHPATLMIAASLRSPECHVVPEARQFLEWRT